MSECHYERLGAQDVSFLPHESERTPMHIAWVWIFEAGPLLDAEKSLDFERIRARFATVISRVPRLRQRLAFVPVENDPVWIDDDGFDIANHIRCQRLGGAGDDRALQALTGDLVSACLDRDRPLWEIAVVEGLAGERFAVLCKMHHSMVDGASFVHLMSLFFDEEQRSEIDSEAPVAVRPAPDRWTLLRDALARRVEMPGELVREARSALQGLGAVSEDDGGRAGLGSVLAATWNNVRLGLTLAPRTAFNQPLGSERAVGWVHLDLARAREIRKALGGTVNDVVLATVAGGVRAYLERHDGLTEAAGFRVAVPVDTRTPEQAASLGNNASGWVFGLPVDEPDVLSRYRRVVDEARRHKEAGLEAGATTLYQAAEWAGYHAVAFGVAVVERLRPYNLIVSNHARLESDIHLLEAKMLEGCPLNPLFVTQGLAVSLTGYRGKLMLGLVADPRVVPDLADFEGDLADAFEELAGQSG